MKPSYRSNFSVFTFMDKVFDGKQLKLIETKGVDFFEATLKY